MKFNYIAHDNQSKSVRKWWPGKLSSFKWKTKMDETNWSRDFYLDIFSSDFDSLLNTKQKCNFSFEKFVILSGFHIPIIWSKVVTDHVFALESFSRINKYSKTEILAFCYWLK